MNPVLDIILHVITRPNHTFAHIRDSGDRYFVWSVGIYLFASTLFGIPVASYNSTSEYWSSMAKSVAIIITTGVVSASVIYLVGERLGGNKSWKKVFTVVFCSNVYIIPMSVVLMALPFPAAPPAFLDDPPTIVTYGTLNSLSVVVIFLIIIFVIMGFFVWGAILHIKAVKIINGFGTAKTIGLCMLAGIIAGVVGVALSI